MQYDTLGVRLNGEELEEVRKCRFLVCTILKAGEMEMKGKDDRWLGLSVEKQVLLINTKARM